MNIRQITEDKKQYMDLLLLADPQEDMINRYLSEGEMFALYDQETLRTVSVVKRLEKGRCELKNIATRTEDQGRGYGQRMMQYLCEYYSRDCDIMYAGSGNSAKTMAFYEKCGFVNSHIIPNFFTDHYKEPIFEEGKQLIDMVCLKKRLDLEVDVKRVVDLALEAGRILLKNGGEIFRVEETIVRICARFHVDHVDIFALSHAIFISAENGLEEAYTRVKHVPLSASHLGIVAEVNDLSREIVSGRVGIDEAFDRLKIIEQTPPKKDYFQILAAGLGSGFFGYLLGASGIESLIAGVIGCILYIWVLTAKRHSLSKIIINIVGGVAITTLAIGALYLLGPLHLKLEGMIIGSIMPLVPGMAFINAIRDIADSDFLSGTVRMIDAILVFVYIAIGVGVTLSVYNNMIGGLSI